MIQFQTIGIKKVIFFPYRTARCYPIGIEIPYSDETAEFRLHLAKLCGQGIDNHTMYEVTYSDDETKLYYWFSDLTLRIGARLVKGNW